MSISSALLLTLASPGSAAIGVGTESYPDPSQPSRGGEVPDFDVQFLMEPSNDVLDPLNGKKWAKLEPGSEATYWVIISNHGEENDTFHLELNGPLRESGWNYFFLDQKGLDLDVQLTSSKLRDFYGGRSVATFPIHVIIPFSSSKDSRIPITVKAISIGDMRRLGDDAPVDSDVIYFIIGESQVMYLPDLSQRIFHVEPGEWLTIPFQLSNMGNKDPIDMTVEVEEDAFWRSTYRDFEYIYTRNSYLLEFEWTEAHLSIKQGTKVSKDIRVRIPSGYFESDEIFQFRVSSHIDGYSRYGTSRVYTLISTSFLNMRVYQPESGHVNIIPGEKNITEVRINNDRWEKDIIDEVYLLDPNRVTIKIFNDTMGPISELEVPRNEEISFFVEFHIPSNTPPGRMDLTLVLRPRYYKTIFFNITLNVTVNRSIALLPTEALQQGTISITPGEGRSILFGVRNEGNVEKEVYLDLRMEPPERSLLGFGWSYRTEWVSQVREPPVLMELGQEDIPVRTNGTDTDLGFILPDLKFGQRPSFWVGPGETVWVSLKVEAPGGEGVEKVPPLTVKATLITGEDEVKDEFGFVLNVSYPDLEFIGPIVTRNEKGETIASAKADQKVFLSFTAANLGQAFSDWAMVKVRADGTEIMEIWVKALAPGENVTYVRELTAISGMDRLELELDPGNEVPESNDQFMEGSGADANVIVSAFHVEGGKDDRLDMTTKLLFLSIMVVSSLLISWSVFIYSKRRFP
ncbi:MAG: hypothetical protein MUC62_08360 [Candidatus Thermoplasmatota archaeon]|jgi:hypothetical protein|nr:hypothetical protein [Candidatus Thermoplasmatota archaeon]